MKIVVGLLQRVWSEIPELKHDVCVCVWGFSWEGAVGLAKKLLRNLPRDLLLVLGRVLSRRLQDCLPCYQFLEGELPTATIPSS